MANSRFSAVTADRRQVLAGIGAAALGTQVAARRRPARAQSGPTTVTWFGGRDTSGVTTRQIEAFNSSHTDIQIDYQEQGASSDDLRAAIISVGSSQDPVADIFSINVPNVSEYAAAGWTMPVDDIIPEGERDQFYSGSIDGAVYQGQMYAIPQFNNGPGIWYRKDLLEGAGIEPPKTYDELVAACQALQTPEISGYILPLPQIEQGNINWMEHVWGYGGNLVDADLNVTLDEGTAAVDAYHRLLSYVYDDKVVPEFCLTLAQTTDAMNIFINGEAVFLRMWLSSGGELLKEGLPIEGKWDVTTLPSLDGAAPGPGCLGTWNLGISTASRNPEAAAEVIRFLTSEEQQKFRMLDSGNLPSRVAVVDDAEIIDRFPYAQRMQEALQSLRPRPVTPYYGQWAADVLQPSVGAVMTKQITPEEAVPAMADQMRQIAGQ